MFYVTMWPVFLHARSGLLVHNLHESLQRSLGILAACWVRMLSQIRKECCGLYVMVRPCFWVEENCGCGPPWESLWTAGMSRRAQGYYVQEASGDLGIFSCHKWRKNVSECDGN